MTLPRGRFTDALVAFATFVFLFLMFSADVQRLATEFGFMPAEFIAGTWRSDPLRALLSPLASRFIEPNILGFAFNAMFLLIVGRFVEKAVGPVGLIALFVAGAYLGAVARLLFTPTSMTMSMGMTPSLFAIIGAYLMLYGVPSQIPVGQGQRRPVQILLLALIWAGISLAFMLASGSVELSVSLVEPIGGLIAGLLLARPLLRWRYRRA